MSGHGIELNLPDLPEVPIRLGPEASPPEGASPRASRSLWDRLREGLATYLPLLLMAVLAAFTGWLVKSSPRESTDAASKAVRAGPDYSMTGFQVQRFDAEGRVKVLLEGDRLRHYAQSKIMDVEGAKVHAFATNGSETWATATRATANDAATEVELSGGVKVRGRLSDGRLLEIDSEFLKWSTETDRLHTHLPARVKVGATEVHAAALDYDRAHQRLQLKGPLRGEFALATAK